MQLHFKVYGSGPPLVILHGLLGSSGNWHTLASKAFGPRFTTYAVDQRNHGRSPHAEDFSYGHMAADLRAFLDAQGLGQVHLLGHSMGGKAAMRFALDHPERVDRLVVADMAPRAYAPGFDDIFAALRSVDLAQVQDRQEVDQLLARTLKSVGVRQFLLKNLAYDSATGTYSWQMNLEVLHESLDHLSEAIIATSPFEKPALFVRGERSDYVRDEDWPEIQRLFPQARLATIPAAGHWVHAEAPQPFAEAVLTFLLSQQGAD